MASVNQLEMKYAELFKPLYEKRSEIVNAIHEPTDEESKWVEPGEDEEDEESKAAEVKEEKMDTEEKSEEEKTESEKFADEVKSKLKLDMDENTKGIPEFWLTAMKNVELLGDMIQVNQSFLSLNGLYSCSYHSLGYLEQYLRLKNVAVTIRKRI